MKLTADYKWRRLRRWVRECYLHEIRQATSANPGFTRDYHVHRRDVYRAVLLVMDAENRRTATKGRDAKRAASTVGAKRQKKADK